MISIPVLNAIFEKIHGTSPYKSPTDMGVNMAGFCITDDDAVCCASKQEIIRRYYNVRCAHKRGFTDNAEIYKLELLMNQLHISAEDRPVVKLALDRADDTGMPAVAIELPDGRIVTGKTSSLLGSSAAALLNALKELAGIEHGVKLISPHEIEPIQFLKTNYMGNHNPRLHADEILIALAICGTTNPDAQKALMQLDKLRGAELHSTVILSGVDENVFKRLGVNITCEPQYNTKKLYHK